MAGVDQREPPARAQSAGANGRLSPVVRAPRWGLHFTLTPASCLRSGSRQTFAAPATRSRACRIPRRSAKFLRIPLRRGGTVVSHYELTRKRLWVPLAVAVGRQCSWSEQVLSMALHPGTGESKPSPVAPNAWPGRNVPWDGGCGGRGWGNVISPTPRGWGRPTGAPSPSTVYRSEWPLGSSRTRASLGATLNPQTPYEIISMLS